MKLPALAFGVLVLFGCSPSESNGSSHVGNDGTGVSSTFSGNLGRSAAFFTFDLVEHYFAPIDEAEVFSLLPQEEDWNGVIDELSENIRFTWGVVHGDDPQVIPEPMSAFINKLADLGYTRTAIDTIHNSTLNEMFREKPEDRNAEVTTCIAVYRDILVFKRHAQVVGIAKICFDCNRHHLVGTNADTRNFGQHGDYSKLAQILL